jgi:hypothetical protein
VYTSFKAEIEKAHMFLGVLKKAHLLNTNKHLKSPFMEDK